MRRLVRAAAAALALSLIALIPMVPATAATVVAAQDTLPHNHTGVWWKSSESGWGINFSHQDNIIFATWFTFAADGAPQWFTVLAQKTAENVYAGNVRSFTGLPFNSVPYGAGANGPAQGGGTATITFAADGKSATFAYTVNGIAQTKEITPQQFVPEVPLPTCVGGAPAADLALATNYQGLWWATHGGVGGGDESGWGINFNHQGKVIFATWFTYDTNGKGWWLFSVATETAPKVYTGTIRTAAGPAFSTLPWDPNAVVRTTVGNGTITFTHGNLAQFDYTVNGISQSKSLVRQVFGSGTVCSFPDQSASFVTQLTDLAGQANSGAISDEQYVTQLAALLATIDGKPGAVAQLEAYLEANVVGHGIPFTAAAADKGPGTTKAVSGSLLAAIKASPSYQLLLAAYAAVTFSQTADPAGNFLQVANPATMVLLTAVAVRTQILDAEFAGTITGVIADELLGFTANNPYDALRRLLILQGVAIPAWLLPAPINCVVNCVDVTHTYAGPVNETAQLSYTIPAVPPFIPATNCTLTVNFTGNVSMVLTVHADQTVDGTATATGTFKATVTNNPVVCPLQTIPVNETITITGRVDHFTAAINVGNGLFPGTLVGQLINDNTVSGQIQVKSALGGSTVVVNFTLTRI